MSFVHYDLGYQSAGTSVRVTLDQQANVMMLDDINLGRYRQQERFEYFGGRAIRSPLLVGVPRSAHWHVVIDLGGASGAIRSSVDVVPAR
jgi:hypothetical protein